MHSVGDSIGKKSRLALFDLVSLLAKKPNLPTSSTTPLFKGGKGGSKRVGRQVFGLALFIAVVLVSESVAATPKQFSPPEPNYIVQGKQQKAKGKILFPFSLSLFPSDDATRAAAEQAFQEGEQLRKQGTAESLRQAITKYEEALPLYRAVGDRRKEALTLNNIGYIYSALGEKQKALEYFNQSLPLSRATGDKAGEARTLSNIGAVYSALGEKQTALELPSLILVKSTAI